MSLTSIHSLSKGDNEPLSIINENISSTENMRNNITVDNSIAKSQSIEMKSSEKCSGRDINTKFDIDIGYAIKLLKKEDESVNVYNHLQGILDKISSERPTSPLENFEKYSQLLKRTYIHKEVNFERVFIDNINRSYCQKSLQMYKCALKKQSEKQKQYNINKNNSKNPENVIGKKKKIIVNNSNNINVQVQNLFEVNLMFNKAGCGLPLDEVALISMSMNEMALLNKFKKIRFWGKIFGIKKIYFIIECEWTDAELTRKTLKADQDTRDTSIDVSVVAQMNMTKKNDSSESKHEMESVRSTVNKFQDSIDSNVSVFDVEMTNDAIKSDDSWTSSRKNYNCETETSEVLPPEMIGKGANKRVYFVSNELNSKWIELDSVQPYQIVEARRIKRYFTGKLNQPIISFPKFKGMELDYLRAQIARISSSTQICPRGYYVFNSATSTSENTLEKTQSEVSSNFTETINFDLIPNKNVKPIPNKDMINLNYWVHKNPQINDTGITANHPGALFSSKLIQDSNIDEISVYEELEEYEVNNKESSLNANGELFGNLSQDITIENESAWKGFICSPFNTRYSYTVMMSHIWPGAYAVVDKLKTDFVYIGWAQKQDCSQYAQLSSKLIDGYKMEMSTKESQTEYEEVQKIQNNQITDLELKLQIPSNEYIFEEVENELSIDYDIE